MNDPQPAKTFLFVFRASLCLGCCSRLLAYGISAALETGHCFAPLTAERVQNDLLSSSPHFLALAAAAGLARLTAYYLQTHLAD